MSESLKYQKEERLKKRTVIDRMFKREGYSFSVHPIRVIYLETELDTNFRFQFAFSVPKRRFRKAVDRNHVRRKMFEAVRLHKGLLANLDYPSDQQCAVMLIFTGNKKVPYQEVEVAVRRGLKKLGRRLTDPHKQNDA